MEAASHLAASIGREAIVRLLLEAGADKEAKANGGRHASHRLRRSHGREAVRAAAARGRGGQGGRRMKAERLARLSSLGRRVAATRRSCGCCSRPWWTQGEG